MIKKILLVTVAAMLATSCGGSKKADHEGVRPGEITILHVNDFEALVQERNIRVIDVRTPHEFAEGHISGAENIDVQKPDFMERLRPKGSIAVYCRTGRRSHQAAVMIAEQGWPVYDLGGGIMAWMQSGKPTVR